MKLALILSNDWELFGDGSGDYFEIQHQPLQALLKAVSAHGAKITVFAEVGQQFAHEEVAAHQPWAARIAGAWRDILKAVVQQGSDVQLHLHTQWLNATWRSDKWNLNYDEWAIGRLPAKRIQDALRRGQDMLNGLLQAARPEYKCIAFRAGAYCIEPSDQVVPVLRQLGIVCDSSITKGLVVEPFFNYRGAHSNIHPWHVGSNNVQTAGVDRSLLEIPIASLPGADVPVLRRFAPRWFYLAKFRCHVPQAELRWIGKQKSIDKQRYPMSSRPFARRRSLSWMLSKLYSQSAFQLDYDQVPASIIVRSMERLLCSPDLKRYRDTDTIIPVMTSGHVKNMPTPENVDRLLYQARQRFGSSIEFWTLSEAVEYWNRKSCAPELAVAA